MLLYKITGIVIAFTLLFGFCIKCYYAANPIKFKRDLTNKKFDKITFCGLMVITSVILAFMSIVTFIIRL